MEDNEHVNMDDALPAQLTPLQLQVSLGVVAGKVGSLSSVNQVVNNHTYMTIVGLAGEDFPVFEDSLTCLLEVEVEVLYPKCSCSHLLGEGWIDLGGSVDHILMLNCHKFPSIPSCSHEPWLHASSQAGCVPTSPAAGPCRSLEAAGAMAASRECRALDTPPEEYSAGGADQGTIHPGQEGRGGGRQPVACVV